MLFVKLDDLWHPNQLFTQKYERPEKNLPENELTLNM